MAQVYNSTTEKARDTWVTQPFWPASLICKTQVSEKDPSEKRKMVVVEERHWWLTPGLHLPSPLPSPPPSSSPPYSYLLLSSLLPHLSFKDCAVAVHITYGLCVLQTCSVTWMPKGMLSCAQLTAVACASLQMLTRIHSCTLGSFLFLALGFELLPCHVAQTGLRSMISLPLPPRCQDYRHFAILAGLNILGFFPVASVVSNKAYSLVPIATFMWSQAVAESSVLRVAQC